MNSKTAIRASAIGKQFEASVPAPTGAIAQRPPPEKETVLDEATRENRREAERFLDRALSAAAASVGERQERAHHAAEHDTHVTRTAGYEEWRDDARRVLDDCRRILDDPETFGRHLDRRPGAEDDLKRLSSRLETGLKADSAEIERVRLEKEAQVKQEREAQDKAREKTRDMDMGLEL